MKSYEEEIEKLANDFIEENEEELKEIIKENIDEEEDFIYEHIYQDWDLIDKIHEFLDGNWYSFLRSEFLDDCKTEVSSCAKILDYVVEEETDSGLWEGQQPEQAIITKAFFSVRNDLFLLIKEKIKEMIEKLKEQDEEDDVDMELAKKFIEQVEEIGEVAPGDVWQAHWDTFRECVKRAKESEEDMEELQEHLEWCKEKMEEHNTSFFNEDGEINFLELGPFFVGTRPLY